MGYDQKLVKIIICGVLLCGVLPFPQHKASHLYCNPKFSGCRTAGQLLFLSMCGEGIQQASPNISEGWKSLLKRPWHFLGHLHSKQCVQTVGTSVLKYNL